MNRRLHPVFIVSVLALMISGAFGLAYINNPYSWSQDANRYALLLTTAMSIAAVVALLWRPRKDAQEALDRETARFVAFFVLWIGAGIGFSEFALSLVPSGNRWGQLTAAFIAVVGSALLVMFLTHGQSKPEKPHESA